MSATKQFSFQDCQFMARALELAKKGLYGTSPNPRVGAVLVKNNQIIGEGWHQRAGDKHAEVMAIEDANARGLASPENSHCYVTLEPCAHFGHTAPCADALIKAGINKVTIAMVDPNPKVSGKGIKKLTAAGIEVFSGLLKQDAEKLNQGFVSRMTRHRPWVVIKLAMSLDGRTALSNGVSQWISSPESRQEVQRLRAQVCAILTGSGTVLGDDPRMTVREDDLGYTQSQISTIGRQPLRVIIDGQQRLHADYKIFQQPGKSIIVLPQGATTAIQFEQAAVDHDIEVLLAPTLEDNTGVHVDLDYVLQQLAIKWQVNELMVEAGAGLSGALLTQNLFDELQIYMAPKVLGHKGRGLFHLKEFKQMSEIINISFQQFRAVGADIKLTIKASDMKPGNNNKTESLVSVSGV